MCKKGMASNGNRTLREKEKNGVTSPRSLSRKTASSKVGNGNTKTFSRTSRDIASSAETQLALAKYRRKVKKLTQKLTGIEEQKNAEIEQIRGESLKVKEETEKILEEKKKTPQVVLIRKELAALRTENEHLMKQNEKLYQNCRNLRINKMRLEQFGLGNGDYYEQLENHYQRAVGENKRLAVMEAEARKEAIEAQQLFVKFTNTAHADHRLKKMYRKSLKRILKKAEAASVRPALLLKLYDIFQAVEKYEGTINNSLPFDPLKESGGNSVDGATELKSSEKRRSKKSKREKKTPYRGVDKTKSAVNICIAGKDHKRSSKTKSSTFDNKLVESTGLEKSPKFSVARRLSTQTSTWNAKPSSTPAPPRPVVRRASTSLTSFDLKDTKKKTSSSSKKIKNGKPNSASFNVGYSSSQLYDDDDDSEPEDRKGAQADGDGSESSGWSSTDSDSFG